MMAVAALVATAGATNATLFGSAGLTNSLAEIGQFPPLLGRNSRLGRHGGLVLTGILVLLLANLVDLSAIASVGSACSLMVFVLVGIAGYRLRSQTGARSSIVLLGIAVTLVVLGFFAVDTLRNAPETLTAIVGVTLLAVALDLVWKRMRARRGLPEKSSVGIAPSG
jgi:amino acid transporter